jgi:predicted nucleic acid-binding protein
MTAPHGLALTETLIQPLRNGDTELVAIYERLFDTLVQPLPVSREVLIFAAQLRAQTPSLKTPDAIHLATATLAKADAFVSGDSGIKELPAFMQRFSI